MFAPRSLIVASSLALAGCAFFAALNGETQAQAQADAEAEARRQAQEAARQLEESDRQLAIELDSLRAAALAETATLADAVTYVEKYGAALRAGAVERGLVSSSHGDDAWAALETQYGRSEDPGDRATIELARGRLRFDQGRADEAAGHFLAAIQLESSYESFALLISVPKSPTSDAAVLQACPLVRPAVGADTLADFVAVCLDAAAGDRKQLTWTTAKADLKAHDIEMARRAEEQRLREEQEARRAAEEAELAAAAAANVELWATAAVFAAGRCRFSNCLTDGWEASTDQGTVTTTCRFSDCLKDGWETRFPDGSTATTSCRFSDCMKDGWETRFPDGSTATTSCRFSNCPVDGWETRLPDGSTATTSCRFSDCFKDGWETRMPGHTVSCSCRFSNCLEDGTDCG